MTMKTGEKLVAAARQLSREVGGLSFPAAAYVYNPLDYAQEAHARYLETYGSTKKRVVFLGMNPGPWGMAQTGVPFGEIEAVKRWLKIEAPIGKPDPEHPKRPVLGFACQRSEVSGRRLWGLFEKRFGRPEDFFCDHFVANYCPLMFLEASGRNLTPDKLSTAASKALFAACDQHLQQVVNILEPQWLVGVGRFSEKCARRALADSGVSIGQILHPSPASPAANRDWPAAAARQLQALGIW